MKKSPDERHKKEHMKTLLICFDTHGGLSQSEKIMYVNTPHTLSFLIEKDLNEC